MRLFITRSMASLVALGFAITLVPATSQASVTSNSIDYLLSTIAPETRQDLSRPAPLLRSATQDVVIPLSLSEPIVLTGDNGTQIAIDLPNSVSTAQATVAGVPITTFDGGNDSLTLPLSKRTALCRFSPS